MGIIDKIKNGLFGAEYEDDYLEDDYEIDEKPTKLDVPEYQPRTARRDKIVNIHTSVQMEVVVTAPASYDDAQTACDYIKTKKPVVVNLEKVETHIAQRIMDFLSGACYSLNGSVQRVSNNIFIIAPENVDISANFKEELKSKGLILPWVGSGAYK